MIAVLTHAVGRRRASLAGWSAGLVGIVGLLAVAYPAVRDNSELDKTFADLPPGVLAILGLDAHGTLTSPVGYLNSQFFANVLPVMLLVFAIGRAAWSISGDEAAGTLELLLANPIGRARVAVERAAALTLQLAALAAVCAVALLALAHPAGLDAGLPAWHILAATAAATLLALTFGALTFAIGAATGSRTAAVATGTTAAAAGYVVQGLAHQVHALQPIRVADPWHWLIDTNPLATGLGWQAGPLPLAVSIILLATGVVAVRHRDLR